MKFSLLQFLLLLIFCALVLGLYTSIANLPKNQTFRSLAFSEDGRFLAAQSTAMTYVFDLKTGRTKYQINMSCAEMPDHVEFTDDNHLLVVGFGPQTSHDRSVCWIDIEKRRIDRSIDLEEFGPYTIFNPSRDGFVLQDGFSDRVEYHSKSLSKTGSLSSMTTSQFTTSVDMSLFQFRDQSHSFFNGTHNDFSIPNVSAALRVKDFSEILIDDIQNPAKQTPLGAYAERCQISPDGSQFVMARQKTLSLFERKTGNLIWTQEFGTRPLAPAFSTNGKYVVAGNHTTAYALDAADGKLLTQRALENVGFPIAKAISNNGLLALSGQHPSLKGIAVWDGKTGQLLFSRSSAGSHQQENFKLALMFALAFTAWCIVWACYSQINLSRPTKPHRRSTAMNSLFLLSSTYLIFFNCQLATYLLIRQETPGAASTTMSLSLPIIGLGAGCFIQILMIKRLRADRIARRNQNSATLAQPHSNPF